MHGFSPKTQQGSVYTPGSSLATANLDNDFTGVSEKYAHRRVFDETIDLTFYCDAKEYLPIRFFESWMSK